MLIVNTGPHSLGFVNLTHAALAEFKENLELEIAFPISSAMSLFTLGEIRCWRKFVVVYLIDDVNTRSFLGNGCRIIVEKSTGFSLNWSPKFHPTIVRMKS